MTQTPDKNARLASIDTYEHELRERSSTTIHDEMIRLLCEWARESAPSHEAAPANASTPEAQATFWRDQYNELYRDFRAIPEAVRTSTWRTQELRDSAAKLVDAICETTVAAPSSIGATEALRRIDHCSRNYKTEWPVWDAATRIAALGAIARDALALPSAIESPSTEAQILAAKIVVKKGEFADVATASTAALLLSTEILRCAHPNGAPRTYCEVKKGGCEWPHCDCPNDRFPDARRAP